MPNMSYCRWHNTSLAMQECNNSIEDLDEEAYRNMADFEQQGLLRAAREAAKMLAYLPLEVLKMAEVELGNIPLPEDVSEAGEYSIAA